MSIIGIEGIKVIAPIGVYEEERAIGSRFLVDVYIDIDIDIKQVNDDLGNTVDYEFIYRVVTAKMTKKFNLIETVLQEIFNGIKEKYPDIKNVKIRVKKLNPIGGDKVDTAFIEEEF